MIKGLGKKTAFVFYMATMVTFVFAQNGEHGWHLGNDGNGIAINKAYDFLGQSPSEHIIVAVIDSGVDTDHEDLKPNMWINNDEIPGNGIDDDHNGYVDDIHGWSFIGGKDGDVGADNFEITRLYKAYKSKFKNADVSKMSKKDRKLYSKYLEIKKTVEGKKDEADSMFKQMEFTKTMLEGASKGLEQNLKEEGLSFADLDQIKSRDQNVLVAINVIQQLEDQGLKISSLSDLNDAIRDEIGGAVDYFKSQSLYHYNPDFNARKIVGDNYNNSRERNYGNNNVEGPDAFHGTFVAGLIAAVHQNDLGISGVAKENVSIMAIRAVPNGDERDKDVANAIRYAVDNGASIINMSFGKSYSWDKQVVDEAVKYAIKKDVLLVHASGNDNKDNDVTENYPNDEFSKKGLFAKKHAKNFLEVGALHFKTGEDMIAPFSNYGDNRVDVFAPGMAIYSTSEHNSYKSSQGTSFAAPIVAGLAAIIRSHYPALSAEQVKSILIDSSIPKNVKVRIPGKSEEMKQLKDISVAGGIINAYTAIKMASETKGKYPNRKVKIARP